MRMGMHNLFFCIDRGFDRYWDWFAMDVCCCLYHRLRLRVTPVQIGPIGSIYVQITQIRFHGRVKHNIYTIDARSLFDRRWDKLAVDNYRDIYGRSQLNIYQGMTYHIKSLYMCHTYRLHGSARTIA